MSGVGPQFGTLEILKTDPKAILPTRSHPEDAGLDLYGLEDRSVEPGQGVSLRTGVAAAIAEGFVGLVADRSSLAKRGLKTAGGVIDAGYRGEIQVLAWNLGPEPIRLKAGDRIAQLLLLPVATPVAREVDRLSETRRGHGGFGSTGA